MHALMIARVPPRAAGTEFPLACTGSVPAGRYTVGSCAQNLGVNSINKSVHSAGAVYSGS
jgi:hypothetical protein